MDINLKAYLDQNGVSYSRVEHTETFTALETAAAAHIPGKEIAKTVIVELDNRPVMVVVPATHQVDLAELRAMTGAKHAELAEEREFVDLFPGCERGAEPPFRDLYGLDVYASEALAEDEEIAFNAGTHRELVRMAYKDFARLARPVLGPVSQEREMIA